MSSDDLLNVKEAAIFLRLSESQLRHLMLAKKILYYKPVGKIYFKKSDLDNWILKAKINIQN